MNREERRQYMKVWRKSNPEKVNASREKWKYANREKALECSRRSRGLPQPTRPEPFFCECCGFHVWQKSLCLDHDHETGEFRGWLCDRCNVGIGQLGDDVAGLQRAIDYLNRSK